MPEITNEVLGYSIIIIIVLECKLVFVEYFCWSL